MVEPRRRIDTVLGAVAVVPECKVQAVCTNGSKCWEAGECLRAELPPPTVIPWQEALGTDEEPG